MSLENRPPRGVPVNLAQQLRRCLMVLDDGGASARQYSRHKVGLVTSGQYRKERSEERAGLL